MGLFYIMSRWLKSGNRFFTALFLSLWALIFASGLFAVPSQTEWFVAGTGAVSAGDDRNPGTADLPLASIYRALSLIKDAFAAEPFDTAVIKIEGAVWTLPQ